MLSRARPLLAFALLSSVAGLIGGCYDDKPVEDRAMINALAFDQGPEGTYTVTGEEARPLTPAGGAATGGVQSGLPPPPAILYAGTAVSISDAVTKMQLKSPKALDFVSLGIVVFSKPVAEEGISVPLNYLVRAARTRMLAWAMVTEGPAAPLLALRPVSSTRSAVKDLIEAQGQQGADIPEIASVPIWEVFRDTVNREADTVLPLVRIVDDQATFVGSALFHDGRMTGTLSPEQTATLQILTKSSSRGTLQVDTGNGAPAILKLSRVRVVKQMRPGPQLTVRVNALARLTEAEKITGTPTAQQDRRIEQLADERMAADIRALYAVLIKHNCDALGLGAQLRAKAPHEWDSWRASWPAPLKDIPLQIKVDIEITSPEI